MIETYSSETLNFIVEVSENDSDTIITVEVYCLSGELKGKFASLIPYDLLDVTVQDELNSLLERNGYGYTLTWN